jgi:3-hydroxyisobutyrate dehydrogenase-like beta-hydroxyacid dehydrogenase
MKDIRNVGMIGLGKMGLPMARLLRERGFCGDRS